MLGCGVQICVVCNGRDERRGEESLQVAHLGHDAVTREARAREESEGRRGDIMSLVDPSHVRINVLLLLHLLLRCAPLIFCLGLLIAGMGLVALE
jgi:hypothetical protein